jgi:hypothetical protein
VGKRGREEASVHVLKPRGVLHGRTGAGDAGGARGDSGGGGATWSGRGSGGQGVRGHVARLRVAPGRRVRGTWPARVAVVGRRENRGGRGWRKKTRTGL